MQSNTKHEFEYFKGQVGRTMNQDRLDKMLKNEGWIWYQIDNNANLTHIIESLKYYYSQRLRDLRQNIESEMGW